MRAGKRLARALAVTIVAGAGTRLSAHRLDQVLQAARIGVEPERVHVEMDLTAGTAVAEAVIREIDGNGDGVFSPAERQGYAERVLSRVSLAVDDLPPLRLSLVRSSFPDAAAMRTGEAAIRFDVEAAMPRLPAAAHRLIFRNDDTEDNGVYLTNALVPADDRVQVTGQRRDLDQRELAVEFALRDTWPVGDRWAWLGLACAFMLVVSLARWDDRASARTAQGDVSNVPVGPAEASRS